MKRMKKFLGLGLGVAAVFGLASCSNGVNEPNTPNGPEALTSVKLVKTPDVVAWTGKTVLGDSRATRGYYYENDETGKEKKYYMHDEEVEVNLAVLKPHAKYDIEDLAAKLSIHVRNANDVKVTLPITAQYIVDSDDLAIFKSHNDGALGKLSEIYELMETKFHTATYDFSFVRPALTEEEKATGETITVSKRVSLTVTFNDNDITIETSGVKEIVEEGLIEYGEYHDGMNFEVFIYLNAEKEAKKDNYEETYNLSAFQTLLNNRSSIEFTGELTPKYYINAFTGNVFELPDAATEDEIEEALTVGIDCTVTPPSTYKIVNNAIEHLNGKAFNVLYMVNGTEGTADHAHGGPVEVPDQGKPYPEDQQN